MTRYAEFSSHFAEPYIEYDDVIAEEQACKIAEAFPTAIIMEVEERPGFTIKYRPAADGAVYTVLSPNGVSIGRHRTQADARVDILERNFT